MAKEFVTIGIANEGTTNLETDIVKTWKPTNISRFKDTVYFKSDGTYYSMKREDYVKIFNEN